ncbi:hypothetical protein MCAMS1_01249 [biofilm metagenome]
MGELIIFAIAVLSIITCIVAFLKTPPNQRYRFTTLQIPIEERLAACPKSAEAVIIRADKKYVLFWQIFTIIVILAIACFHYWSEQFEYPQCLHIFGYRHIYVLFIFVIFIMPLGLFFLSINFIQTGIKIFKTGYFPPLDTKVITDKIAKKGLSSKIIGIFIILVPLLFLYCGYYAINFYQSFFGDMDLYEIRKVIEIYCEQSQNFINK